MIERQMIKVRRCDMCSRVIGLVDEGLYKLVSPMDYKVIHPLDNTLEYDICEDCVAKIVAAKFQIGKEGVVKE